jgi:hypothetical protein
MLGRRLLQAGVAICIFAASTLGLGSAAQAAPTTFTAAAIHSNGAGALAVEATGGLSWGNRSVTLTSVRFYAGPGECGYFRAEGYQGGSLIDFWYGGSHCGGTTGKWFTIGTYTLDASSTPGGITDVELMVVDQTHAISAIIDCYRTASLCL